MAELLIALAPFLVVAGLALAALFVPLQLIASSALSLMAVGLVFGVPSGLYYHVALRRELLRQGGLPRGWYWHPQRYHRTLEAAALRRLRPWFFVGALGFGLIVTGFTLAVTALTLWFRSEGAVLP